MGSPKYIGGRLGVENVVGLVEHEHTPHDNLPRHILPDMKNDKYERLIEL